MSGNKKATINIDNNYIESEYVYELLGINIDSKYMFKNHINFGKRKVKNETN